MGVARIPLIGFTSPAATPDAPEEGVLASNKTTERDLLSQSAAHAPANPAPTIAISNREAKAPRQVSFKLADFTKRGLFHHPMSERTAEVAVIGGGIIGLGVAWKLLQYGHSVCVVEADQVGRQASWQAAGMLSPAAEIGFEELELYHLGRESLRRWPAFARELENASGMSVGYRDDGTLVVAHDRDDAEALRRLFHFQEEQGVPVRWLAGFEAMELEPMLSPGLPAAIHSPEDHQVDNRAVVQALAQLVHSHPQGMLLDEQRVVHVNSVQDELQLEVKGQSSITCKVAIVAAGAWSAGIGGLDPKPLIRPIKGQVMALQAKDGLDLSYVVRGPDAYLVPKGDGRIIVGATSEDLGFDDEVTAGGVYRMLEGAVEIVPGVEEMEFLGVEVGLRPASRDQSPLLGWMDDRIMYATGHYRHGILLMPVTAEEVAQEVDAKLKSNNETSDWLAPFSPKRFS